ncbi:MAG: acetate--CoA ligase family protein [Candidatus Anammoxibacter sp.]
MKNIFSPQSIAVVGASKIKGKVGHDIFENILRGGFTGTLYPVNPKAASVCSVKAYPSISAIGEQIDLAILIVPPAVALEVSREAVKCNVKSMIIVSAGFCEVGETGAKIEEEIAKICTKANIRVVGPNCLGVINTDLDVSLNASFARRMPHNGKIAFISQSGALCTAVLDFAAGRNIGFSKFISTGNKCDVDEIDLLEYLHEDEETEVILMYIEELKRVQDFINVAKEITGGRKPTPILAMKSGRTTAGAKAASSHTGSMAGTEAVYEAIFHQSGIVRADTIEDLFNFSIAFATRRLPRSNRVAIVTNAGGPGIIATDVTAVSGLKLAEFKTETTEALQSYLPPTANINNPVDIIGDATKTRYKDAISAVINDENVDGVIVILTPQSMTDIVGTAEIVKDINRQTDKPIIATFMGIVDVSEGVKILENEGIPVYKFPEDAARAFGALYQHNQWIHRPHLREIDIKADSKKAKKLIQAAIKNKETYLGEIGGNDILQCYGFPLLSTTLATTADEAVKIAGKIEGRVALKIVSPDVIHKSDSGGIALHLKTDKDVKDAFNKIIKNVKSAQPDANIRGVLVQEIAKPGVEVILGATNYKNSGPLLMFGLGGIFVEIFKDVSFRLAPVTHNSVRAMIKSIKGFPMLNGARGQKPSDINETELCLLKLSLLMVENPEISEIDINPLIVHEKGAGVSVADCRIILKS